MKKEKYYYVAVSNDKFEWPLFVADNYKQLSNWSGQSIGALKRSIFFGHVDSKLNCRYIRVLRIDDEEKVYQPVPVEIKITFSIAR